MAWLKHGALVGLWFFYLDDHVRVAKDEFGRVDNTGTRRLIGLVGKTNGSTTTGLHRNGVSVGDQLPHARWRHADAMLVQFDLSRNAYSHVECSNRSSPKSVILCCLYYFSGLYWPCNQPIQLFSNYSLVE